jgi:hypothetical protein
MTAATASTTAMLDGGANDTYWQQKGARNGRDKREAAHRFLQRFKETYWPKLTRHRSRYCGLIVE